MKSTKNWYRKKTNQNRKRIFLKAIFQSCGKEAYIPRQSPLVRLSRIIDAMAAMHWRNFHALKFGALGLVAKTFEFRVGFDANQLSWRMPNSVLYVLYEFFYNTLCFKHLFIYVRDLGKSLCRIKKRQVTIPEIAAMNFKMEIWNIKQENFMFLHKILCWIHFCYTFACFCHFFLHFSSLFATTWRYIYGLNSGAEALTPWYDFEGMQWSWRERET